MTRTSTPGGRRAPRGLCPHSPQGPFPPLPCRALRGRPTPASAGDGDRPGPRDAGPPSGGPPWEASVGSSPHLPPGGGGTWAPLGAGAPRPPYAPRHGDPGPPCGLGRTQGQDLRAAAPGPASAGPTVAHRTFDHGTGLRPRPVPTVRDRDTGSLPHGPTSVGPGTMTPVRPHWADPASAGDAPAAQRPSPGCTMPPVRRPPARPRSHWTVAPGMEKSVVGRSAASSIGGLYPDATPDRTGVKAPRACPFKPAVHWQRALSPRPVGVHLYFFQTRNGNRDCYHVW